MAGALTDGCSLNNGTSKALGVSDYDADTLRVASRQFDIGSIRSDITVTDDRTITNPNNTVRREIDVRYVVDYRDGTRDEKATQTLISGSSAGSTLADGSACAASQDSADLRFFGNRKIANTFVTASNEVEDRVLLATGLFATPAVTYNRYIRLGVSDPAKIATYATISGPGLTTTLKMVSPRLLRDDPLFAGKNGNFVDWRDTDTFKFCRTPNGKSLGQVLQSNKLLKIQPWQDPCESNFPAGCTTSPRVATGAKPSFFAMLTGSTGSTYWARCVPAITGSATPTA